jgi:hypothetical protein
MPNQDDVRQIALSLPGVAEGAHGFGFSVENRGKWKSFAWAWNERIEPEKPRVANPAVLAVRVAGEEQKQFLIGAVPSVFFTEPHYKGFPAVLVRLGAIELDHLRELLIDGWRIQAPRAAVRQFDAPRDSASA